MKGAVLEKILALSSAIDGLNERYGNLIGDVARTDEERAAKNGRKARLRAAMQRLTERKWKLIWSSLSPTEARAFGDAVTARAERNNRASAAWHRRFAA